MLNYKHFWEVQTKQKKIAKYRLIELRCQNQTSTKTKRWSKDHLACC